MTTAPTPFPLPIELEPPAEMPRHTATSFFRSPCRFLSLHRWFLGLALMDAILTTLVLNRGGEELNAVARSIIETAGLTGMVLFKTMLVVVVLLLIELIGRRRESAARAVAHIAIGANTAAVTMGFLYLALYTASAHSVL